MNRKYRQYRDLAILIVAALLISITLTNSMIGAIIKTDEQRDPIRSDREQAQCEQWAEQYGHDYCND